MPIYDNGVQVAGCQPQWITGVVWVYQSFITLQQLASFSNLAGKNTRATKSIIHLPFEHGVHCTGLGALPKTLSVLICFWRSQPIKEIIKPIYRNSLIAAQYWHRHLEFFFWNIGNRIQQLITHKMMITVEVPSHVTIFCISADLQKLPNFLSNACFLRRYLGECNLPCCR